MRGSGVGWRNRCPTDSCVNGPAARDVKPADDRAPIARHAATPANPGSRAQPRKKRKRRYEGIVLRHARLVWTAFTRLRITSRSTFIVVSEGVIEGAVQRRCLSLQPGSTKLLVLVDAKTQFETLAERALRR
jgi:hypothetical protein